MPEHKPRVVLLVEDNDDDAQRIQRMLRGGPRRYDVTRVSSGAEALSLLSDESRHFDCVLLDYHLPDVEGLEFLRWMRGRPFAVSVLTGRDDDEVAARMLEAGAEEYLLKDGLAAHSLTRSIENVIEKSEIRRQLEAQRAAAEMRSHRPHLTR